MQICEMKKGDKFETEIGNFIVLDHDIDNGTTKVIQENFFAEDVEFSSSTCDYKKSDLKKLFDTCVEEAYKKIFGDAIVEHEVALKSVDMQDYGTFKCFVRPITFDEAREFNDLLVKKDLPDWWWTCTPWSTKERGWPYSVTVVSPSGVIYWFSFDYCSGVRPVCILKSNLFVSKVEE